jgi:hypothetical protein
MIFRSVQGWSALGFLSFEHDCAERLGMHPKTVRQRAVLEEDLLRLPALREAMRGGVVSYEKARLIARFAPESADRWISRAQRISCADLRRELQREEDGKMCARGRFRTFVPRRVHLLVQEAFRAVRKAGGQWFSPGECFGKMCARFMEIWRQPKGHRSRQRKIRERDGGLCQVPGSQPRCGGRPPHHFPQQRRHAQPGESSLAVRRAPPRHPHGMDPRLGRGASRSHLAARRPTRIATAARICPDGRRRSRPRRGNGVAPVAGRGAPGACPA